MVLVKLRDDNDRVLVVVSPGKVLPRRGILEVKIVGQFRTKGGEPDLSESSFSRGKAFTEFLHESIARNGPLSEALLAQAAAQRTGYIYVIDGRTPTPQGNVPNEDIIGSFKIVEGRVHSAAYQRFPEHRIFSARGFVQLEEGLMNALLAEIQAQVPK